jgi:hypothetical protein
MRTRGLPPAPPDDFWKTTQVGKVIGIHNAMVVKGMSGLCAGRVPQAQDLTPFDSNPFAVALNFHSVRIQK